MALICELIVEVSRSNGSPFHLVSVDEKTGVQALERIHEGQGVQIGKERRIEYEYERNGTTCLMAAIDVAKGRVVANRIHPTRKEEDFLAFIQLTVSQYPCEDQIIFLADQLNTHMSEALVKWVAEQIQFDQPLGKKRYKGILKDMGSRRQFLEEEHHRIRFVFTPKHCSWLNPIENWFSKLQRHVIRYGNFSSLEEVEHKIKAYIQFYNQCLVKPFKWKFKGFTKTKPIQHIKCPQLHA